MTDLPSEGAIERPDPQLIQQLFDEDPLKLSDQNIDQIIEFFRNDRVAYMQGPLEKAKKASAKKKAAEPVIPITDDDLAQLGLL